MLFSSAIVLVCINLNFVATDKRNDSSEVTTSPPTTTEDKKFMNQLWKPSSHLASTEVEMDIARPVQQKLTHPVTRLAKTQAHEFAPQFQMQSFEPFERRSKPVTIIGLRKNGFFPRETIDVVERSARVAELQSPYNDISVFWDRVGESLD